MSNRLTPTVKWLLIALVAIFILQKTVDMYLFSSGQVFTIWFGLVPGKFVYDMCFWQVFSYSFLHGSPTHLFFNCLMLYFIGPQIEKVLGLYRFLRLYFFSVFFAGVFYLIAYPMLMPMIPGEFGAPLVGASGGIYGLMMAFGIFFAENTMQLMIPPVPMKVKHFIWVLAGLEFMMLAFTDAGQGLSAVSHLSGMGAGFAYLWLEMQWNRRKAGGSAARKKAAAGHLKLVINRPEESKGGFDYDPPGGKSPGSKSQKSKPGKSDDPSGGPTWH